MLGSAEESGEGGVGDGGKERRTKEGLGHLFSLASQPKPGVGIDSWYLLGRQAGVERVVAEGGPERLRMSL